MKHTLLVFLCLISAIFQDKYPLPKDFWAAKGKPAEQYEIIRFQDTVMLHGSFWAQLFGTDVRQHIIFDDMPVVNLNGTVIEYSKWKQGERLPNLPGCMGTQLDYTGGPKQQPFYFEDRTSRGVTIRGKDGMQIQWWCEVIGRKASSNAGIVTTN
jgi:hypothetical protein